ncbi:carboxylating nicotinate-nucleotide diphosphorylase [bacterium]|nr:carboxylating nicotinate-nucleotide diphosphorylase [bacterium]
MYHMIHDFWKDLLKKGISEDGAPWDWTTLGVRKGLNQRLKAKIIAKSHGVWAAATLVEATRELWPALELHPQIQDGQGFSPQQVLLEWEGPVDILLAVERPFLNLAAYVSGIATQTQEVVKKVYECCPKNSPRVTLTRKTLPGYRDLAIHAVRVGGGYPHRVSLAGGALIKENHIAAAGGILNAVQNVREVAPHGLKIEIEVRDLGELEQAMDAQADVVMLDNFSPADVKKAITCIEKRAPQMGVEVSGGLTLQNIDQYALSGVHVLSVGALTHSARSVDLSFLICEE